MMGLPQKNLMFLCGILSLPPRAGMMQTRMTAPHEKWFLPENEN
jgi:hypothetical protein